jgi:prevent-host-death family protein
MSTAVEASELRRNWSAYLERVERGERLIVTDHDRAVAELAPPSTTLDRLVAEGRVTRPTRRGLPRPLRLEGDPYALSRALNEVRGER